jgi:hypothetical protein
VSLERIEITPVAVIVGEIVQNRQTGHLTILRAGIRRVLYWSQGELVLITSSAPEESLGDFLVRRGVMTTDRALMMQSNDPVLAVARFHESGLLDLSARQALLREWLAAIFVPLFALDEGTAAFTDDNAIEPERRVFLQSTAALVLEGVRTITNGLVLRRSLGELKRDIAFDRDSRFTLDSIPLTDAERRIAISLEGPQTIESFLKHFATESVLAAKVAIGMLALGIFSTIDIRPTTSTPENFDQMQRDLELLAAIGSNDHRSLRAVALSRQLTSVDHYQFLNLPRAATRGQIIGSAEQMRRQYDPATYPPIVRDAIQAITRRIDQALSVLNDAVRRSSYDKLLHERGARAGNEAAIQQRVNQRNIAEQNYHKARELTAAGDYYGAIILLKQAVAYAPDKAEAWFLLASCQERNPKWRREASESYQKALSIDPNYTDALISLGDLYKSEGLISRAQTCYEDALKISPDNPQAKSRLSGMKR